MRKYIAEFIGTFVLVAFGCGSAVAANSIFISMGSPLPIAFTTLLIAFAFGLSIVAMAYSIGNVSGCHINPAVSLGVLIVGKMNVKDFVGYVIAQLAGAVVAALFLMVLFGGRDALGANGYGTSSAVGLSMMAALGLEILMTFVFVLVVLGVTSKKEFAPVAGLVIGLSLTLIHIFGIPFTGTSVNPARSFGPAIVSGGDALNQLPVFIIAPLIGGALAALVFRFVLTETESQEDNSIAEDGLAEKVAAVGAATELQEDEFQRSYEAMTSQEADLEDVAGTMDAAGDEFQRSYEDLASEENGLEEVSEVLDAAGDEFEETYELMTGKGEEEPVAEAAEESAEESVDAATETTGETPEDEPAEETAEESEQEGAEASFDEEEESPAEEVVEAASDEAAEEPAEENGEPEAEGPAQEESKSPEAEESAEEAEQEEKTTSQGDHKGGKHKRQGNKRRKSSKHSK